MKLDIQEIHILQQAIANITIKASDAPKVAIVIEKLDKEFERLQKLEEKKQATSSVAVAK
jgi:hypothetical protein